MRKMRVVGSQRGLDSFQIKEEPQWGALGQLRGPGEALVKPEGNEDLAFLSPPGCLESAPRT